MLTRECKQECERHIACLPSEISVRSVDGLKEVMFKFWLVSKSVPFPDSDTALLLAFQFFESMSLPVYHYSTNLADGYEECLAAKSLSRISSSAEDILIIPSCTDVVMYTTRSPFLIKSMLQRPQTAASLLIVFNFAFCSFAVWFVGFRVHFEFKGIWSFYVNSNLPTTVSSFVAPGQQEVVNI